MIKLVDHTLYEALPYVFMGLGLVLTYRYLRVIDLTFAASFVVGPAIMAFCLVSGVGFGWGLGAALLASAALAGLTLLLILGLDLDSLLASLLASFAGFSVSLLFTQGTISLSSITTPFEALRVFDAPWVAGPVPLHPSQIGFFAVLVALAKVACDRFLDSEMGLAYRAMEDTESAPHLLSSVGLSSKRLYAGGIIAGNLLCAVSGMLVMLKDNQVTAQRGFDAFILVIAAYLLGVTLFERRPTHSTASGWLHKTLHVLRQLRPTTAALAGLITYFALVFVVSRYDVPASVPRLIVVAVIIAGFAISRWPELRARRDVRRQDTTTLAPPDQALVVRDATVTYPGYPDPNEVIAGANLSVQPGELVLLQGTNGSGKSTLLQFIAGRTLGAGNVVVPTASGRSSRKTLVGYIDQNAASATSACLTPREHVALFRAGASPSLIRAWRDQPDTREQRHDTSNQEIDKVLSRTIPARFLSGGQRQVLNLSSLRGRSNSPQVLLFDEPLTHLDETYAQTCVELIERFQHEGRCLVIVQHDVKPGESHPTSPSRARLAELITRAVDIVETQGVATVSEAFPGRPSPHTAS